MEALVIVLAVFVCMDFAIRLSFLRRTYVLALAVVCALFTGLMRPVATAQSSAALSGYVSDPAFMLDMAVLLCADIMLGITFCWLSVRRMDDGGKFGAWQKILLGFSGYFPGITVFIILFWLLMNVIFSFPGVSFALLSWGLAVAVLVAVPLMAFVFRRLVPGERDRLDLMFMAYVITAMAGVVATV